MALRFKAPFTSTPNGFFTTLALLFGILIIGGCSGGNTLSSQPDIDPAPGTMPPEEIEQPAPPRVAVEYFVDDDGDNSNDGSFAAPFKTINHAANLAQPGDTITVREGLYREWVKPVRGGTSEDQRITYRAADGEQAVILGSEQVDNWVHHDEQVWSATLSADFFGHFNPFDTLSRHPIYVAEDEEGDGWGWLKYGRWTHLGDIYIDGEGLTEKQTKEEVSSAPLSWHATIENGQTTLWANFGDANPNDHHIEVNARPYGFFPEVPGLGYITLEGFTIKNIASHWAPPIHYQPAAVGPNGGHHWVIRNNTVMYAKAVCISLGNPTGEASQANSGHHQVTHNILLRCGQAGIAGAGWNKHSTISHNHIEDINYRREFGGWETAGIKHHVTSHLTISHNFIRNVYTVNPELGAAHGIWNDYTNSNWLVTNNIISQVEGISLLTEANWTGPNLYHQNIVIGGKVGLYSSRGDVWTHNLFIDSAFLKEDQDWGNRPKVGNQRWFNNVFYMSAPTGLTPDSLAANNVFIGDSFISPSQNMGTTRTIGSQPTVLSSGALNLTTEHTTQGLNLRYSYNNLSLSDSPILHVADLALPFELLQLEVGARDTLFERDFRAVTRTDSQNLAGPFSQLPSSGEPTLIYSLPSHYPSE